MAIQGKTRIERDSLGEIEVPADAFYGAQTKRAIDNFPIGGGPLPRRFIETLIKIKQAAARANLALGELDATRARAIDAAATELLAGDFMPHFPIDRFQTGSATSTNMNGNEVLARMASAATGADAVDANDHVNRGQSSNDVIPSTIHASAAIALDRDLQPALAHLARTIRDKAGAIGTSVKTGRTHLMDAHARYLRPGPRRLGGRRCEAASALPERSIRRCAELALGGTAVGTGVNAHPEFAGRFCRELSTLTGVDRSRPSSRPPIASPPGLAGHRGRAVGRAQGHGRQPDEDRQRPALDEFSGPMPASARSVLPALQPGSSIMPGKINPVDARGDGDGLRTGHRPRRCHHRRRAVGQLRAQRDAAGDGRQPARDRSSWLANARACWPTGR